MNFRDLEKSVLGISTRTLSTAAIGGLSTYYLLPDNQGSISVMGYSIPTWLIFTGVFGVAGGTNETLRDVMKKYTPATAWIYEFSPVSTGIAASLSMYILNLALGGPWKPTFSQLAYPFLIGGVADYTGMILTDSIVNPIIDVKNIANVNKSLLPEPHILENFPGQLNTILGEQILF
jgi:hypothetical protein